MPQFRPSKYSNLQAGFAPIWIFLLMFLFGGLFFLSKGNLTTVPTSKKVSLYDLCQAEIKLLPKLPFTYEKITSTGSSAEQYRKDRIKDKKNLRDYASCGLEYSTINVIEKTYDGLGLKYYEYSKTDSKLKWINAVSVKQLPKNIDNIYGEILKKQGWVRQTRMGGEDLAYGLPTLIFYKDMGDKNYYIDVVVDPSPAKLYLLIVNK